MIGTLEVRTHTLGMGTYVHTRTVTAPQYLLLSGPCQFLDKTRLIRLAHDPSILFYISIYNKHPSKLTSPAFPQNRFSFGKCIHTKESWPAPVLTLAGRSDKTSTPKLDFS